MKSKLTVVRCFNRKGTATKTKPAPLVLMLRLGTARKFISTGMRLCLGQWDKNKAKAVSCPQAADVNSLLDELEQHIYNTANKLAARCGTLDLDMLVAEVKEQQSDVRSGRQTFLEFMMNEQSFPYRIRSFIAYLGLTIAEFERICEFSNGSLASQIKSSRSIGSNRIEYILSRYPDLSAEWLLRGEGAMLRSTGAAPSVGGNGNAFATAENTSAMVTSALPASSPLNELLALYHEQLRAKDEQIKQLLGLLTNQNSLT